LKVLGTAYFVINNNEKKAALDQLRGDASASILQKRATFRFFGSSTASAHLFVRFPSFSANGVGFED
jgi:hypothetical protein